MLPVRELERQRPRSEGGARKIAASVALAAFVASLPSAYAQPHLPLPPPPPLPGPPVPVPGPPNVTVQVQTGGPPPPYYGPPAPQGAPVPYYAPPSGPPDV